MSEPLRSPEWMMTSRGWFRRHDGSRRYYSIWYQCVCGKVHMSGSAQRCTCGEEFPYDYREIHYRGAA